MKVRAGGIGLEAHMETLLKRDRLGQVVAGSDQLLLERARCGDDITAYEESSTFTCYIIFANYVVSADRVSGLSLPHLAFGDLTDAGRLDREPIETIQYIYDSKCKNLLCRNVLDEERTTAQIYANNPHYAAFTWYSTRRYTQVENATRESLRALGDQFKVRLDLSEDFQLIMDPDIVYFPEEGKEFLIKSSAVVLPTQCALNPRQYVRTSRPLIANRTFSLAYLNIGADKSLTIVHKQIFSADESVEKGLERSIWASEPTPRFEAQQNLRNHPGTLVTRLECDYTILVPNGEW
jgi:hypothetical protein